MLKVEELSIAFRRYRGFWRQEEQLYLEDISFDLSASEVLAVIGASGAGKSLLAHGLMGLLPDDAIRRGKVFLRGQKITQLGAQIGLVAQEVSYLDPLATIGAQQKWAQRRHQKALALQDFNLPSNAYPHEISGGMARRVMIALAGKPEVLIADEPTSGLDEHCSAQVLRHLRAHADEGGAVLLISHDLRAILPFADRVAVLVEGRLCGLERASAFTGDGAGLQSPQARAFWRALPENGFLSDA